jgi:DNA-binding XRE family transcriptional regulator
LNPRFLKKPHDQEVCWQARWRRHEIRTIAWIACQVRLSDAKSSQTRGFIMKILINNAAAIGKVVRASRKAQKIRQDDAAGSIGVSENFLGKIERGGESVQWGKLFQVLEGLGIRVMVDVPESVAAYLNEPATPRDKP